MIELNQKLAKTIEEMEEEVSEKPLEETETTVTTETTTTEEWSESLSNLKDIKDQWSVLTGSTHMINMKKIFEKQTEDMNRIGQIIANAISTTVYPWQLPSLDKEKEDKDKQDSDEKNDSQP